MTSTPQEIEQFELREGNLYIQGPIDEKNARLLGKIVGNSPIIKEVWILPTTDISCQGMEAFVKGIIHNTSLTKMVLYFPVDDQIAIILSEFLKDNQTLRALGLCQSNISNTGRKALIYALQFNYTLEKLGIEGTNMSNQLNKELDHLMSKEERDLRKKKIMERRGELQTILNCCRKDPECLLSMLDNNIIEIIFKKCTSNRFLITLWEHQVNNI